MSAVGRLWAAFTAGPDYPAEPADLRTVTLVGLRLPVRASVAIAVVTFALLFDYSRTFIPGGANAGRGPDAMLMTSIERVILFGLVPLLVILFGFRDRPSRYGLTIGEWRWGAALVVIGCVVMTPIVLWFATTPDARAFYGPAGAAPGRVLLTNALDLTATEFALRGFLMLTLVRLIGRSACSWRPCRSCSRTSASRSSSCSRPSAAGSCTAGWRGGRARSCGGRSGTPTS